MTISNTEALLASYADAWSRNDPDGIASHWCAEEKEPFYKAEEVLHYYHSLPEMLSYWRHNQRFHDAIKLKFSNVTTKSLPGDYALVFLYMRWDIRFAADAKTEDGAPFSQAGKSMGGENHVLAMVRKTADGLKFTGWSETPNAPVTYMRQLYEWVADKDIG